MNDSISRQAAIDALEEPCKVSDTWTDEYAVGERTQWEKDVKALNSLPSAQERKKGKWIEFDSDEDKYDIIKCSHCKHIFTVDSYHWSDIGFVKDDFNFCPNCGADMRGEEDEVD